MEDKKNKAGRKPKDGVIRETKIFIKISEEEEQRIIKMAEYMDIPKSVAARNMTLMSLDEVEAMKRLGILQIAKGIVKTSDWLKAFRKNKAVNTAQEA